MAATTGPNVPFTAEPCRKCTHVNNAHSLRCPTLNLRPGWYNRVKWGT